NGDVYLSTPRDRQDKGGAGIVALHLDAGHKAVQVEHFGSIDGATAIRFNKGALYAASPSGIYRFRFGGNALLPTGEPEAIVEGTPTAHPGFNRINRAIAFDGKGSMFVAVDASANICVSPEAP